MAEPVVTIIRPKLTPEEYERRMQNLKESVAKFWRAVSERRCEDAKK